MLYFLDFKAVSRIEVPLGINSNVTMFCLAFKIGTYCSFYFLISLGLHKYAINQLT